MTEIEVFKDLIEWSEINNRPGLQEYYQSDNKKVLAKKLLLHRVTFEPNYIFLLPDTLLNKIGFVKKSVSDPVILNLARMLNCREVFGVEHA